MKLKTEIIQALREDQNLRYRLAILNECHSITVDRWVEKNGNNSPLILQPNLELIARVLMKTIGEITDDSAPIKNITLR